LVNFKSKKKIITPSDVLKDNNNAFSKEKINDLEDLNNLDYLLDL
jgi:hypothetical protein